MGMKKIDLHIHTISTMSDHAFEYDERILQSYISKLCLDGIAITNHNIFDREQYEQISRSISIPAFPGIEIDIEDGHLLLLTEASELSDFSARCHRVSDLIKCPTDCLTIDQFTEIFSPLDKYLLIPHYDKRPALPLERVSTIRSFIQCGEVNSIKKFISCKKSSDDLTPVFFSDIRIDKNCDKFPARCTYIDVDTLSISTIKHALFDKTKVALSADAGHHLVEVLSNGLKISSGLSVVLGERSSGKTHTLDEIAENVDNTKYVKQFSLLSSSDEEDEKRFEKTLRNRCDSVSEDYLQPFRGVVDDVKDISLEKNEFELDAFIAALLKAAADADKEDIFSKTTLFSETLFDDRDLSPLKELINAVDTLIENSVYRALIDSFVDKSDFVKLGIALREKYIIENELILKKRFLNDIIKSIKSELSIKTAASPVPDIDFYDHLLDSVKVKKFNTIALSLRKEQVIQSRDLHTFKIVATVRPFGGAQELKTFSRRVITFSDAFTKYNEPYEYLRELRRKEELSETELYKYFACIEYCVLNRHGFKASGGERSEYNLLDQLTDATQFGLLLLDEPESSFDNLFLKSDVNNMLKDISKVIPVVVATHNNTIGASVKPDYIIYTKKSVNESGDVQYLIYTGLPTSKTLVELNGEIISKHDILLDCLEAGEVSYVERRHTYEMSSN